MTYLKLDWWKVYQKKMEEGWKNTDEKGNIWARGKKEKQEML